MKNRARRHLFLAAGLSLLLAACGQSQMGGGDETDPYANGADYPWTYSAPGTAQPLAVGAGGTAISFGNIVTATNGWGPVEVNRSNGEQGAGDGRPLTLNGQVYPTGLGVHANSEINVQSLAPLPACTRLSAGVGVDDEVGNRGSVVFQVFADGVKLFDSGVMTGSSATRKLDVALGGKKALRLVVTDAGDGKSYDHADWVNPVLSCNTAPTLTLDRSSLSIYHKHSATLKATFGNLSGPVDLRLEVGAGKMTGLILQTTRVELPAGGGPTTRDVVIRADGQLPVQMVPDPDPLTAPYRLIARQNGQDVASAAVTITEKLLTVSATFEPATVSGRSGETRRVTVVLRVSPPLERAQSFTLSPDSSSVSDYYKITPVGPTYGDGGAMRQDYDITLDFPYPDYPKDTAPSASYYVVAGDFAGYRLQWYWNELAHLEWRLVR